MLRIDRLAAESPQVQGLAKRPKGMSSEERCIVRLPGDNEECGLEQLADIYSRAFSLMIPQKVIRWDG
jgi:hypothetical protein